MDNSSIPGPYARHSHQSSSLSGHDSPSASSVASQTLIPPPSSFFTAVPPPRTQGLPEPLPPVSTASRSPVGYGGPEYGYRPYGTSSGSPSSVAGSSIHDLGSADPYGSAGISPTHLNPNSLSAQKRAYRQRRKDPSCDACRERKVKCDATETSSCSECSSRSVKCQFTKETNRRMSSIKQVQDLQNQLAAKDEIINQLRAQLQNQQRPIDAPSDSPLNLPALGAGRDREHSQPIIHNFDHVRRDIKTFSRGVFKIPPSYRDFMPTPCITTKELELPPRHITNQLLAQYHSHLHRHAPMIHWTSFTREVDRIYAQGNFQGCPQVWIGVFFAVLINGMLQTVDRSIEGLNPDTDGMKMLIPCVRMVNTWIDNLTIDHARVQFLVSNFLSELNLKDTGWVWLGSAVRVAQDMGLHLETGPWSPLELEARRRVAWTIFGCDRLHSLEGRPLTLIEEDFIAPIGPAGFPKNVDEHWMLPHPREYPLSPTNSRQAMATPVLMMPVVRVVANLRSAMKARVIPPTTLKQYDEYFRSVQNEYPPQVRPHVDSYLDPFSLSVCFPLEAARFLLFRHNINIYAQPHERTDAINRILAVAQDSARLISRTMQPPPSSPNNSSHPGQRPSWQDLMKSQASNGICRHIWRCTLVLAFRGDYDAALTCIRASSAIGAMRLHNIACGRYLSHFLDKLQERVERGLYSQQTLEADDEMVALMTGDLQGHPENSWVWAGSEKAAWTPPSPTPLEATMTSNPRRLNGTSNIDLPETGLLTMKEQNDWGGFERCERLLEQIKEEQKRHERRYQEGHAYYQPPQNSAKRLHLAPPDPPNPQSTQQPTPSATTTGSGSSTPVGASRMSIANII